MSFGAMPGGNPMSNLPQQFQPNPANPFDNSNDMWGKLPGQAQTQLTDLWNNPHLQDMRQRAQQLQQSLPFGQSPPGTPMQQAGQTANPTTPQAGVFGVGQGGVTPNPTEPSLYGQNGMPQQPSIFGIQNSGWPGASNTAMPFGR